MSPTTPYFDLIPAFIVLFSAIPRHHVDAVKVEEISGLSGFTYL
jgi:hypothetical protein